MILLRLIALAVWLVLLFGVLGPILTILLMVYSKVESTNEARVIASRMGEDFKGITQKILGR